MSELWISYSRYLIPALFLCPSIVLHLINTAHSYIHPPPVIESSSPHLFIEGLGPLPGAELYLDMHANNSLCWKFTVIMVIFQYLAFNQIGEDIRKKSKKLEKKNYS